MSETTMQRYAILIYADESAMARMTPEAQQAMHDAHTAFAKALAEHGVTMAGGEALQATLTATSVRDGAVTDGPFAETKEALGGFYLIDAPDLDHALRVAALCPAPHGGVEVRPIMDVPGM